MANFGIMWGINTMKKPQQFYRLGISGSPRTTKEEDELLDLCELFGNRAEGVSCLSLGKILFSNGIKTIQHFKDINVDDLSKFNKVGKRRIDIFIKMKEYLGD